MERMEQVRCLCFDTVNTIAARGCAPGTLEAAAERCRRYDALWSKFRPGSDIWRLNHAFGAPVALDDETMAILALAKEFSARTDGVFDITVGSVNHLWHFREGVAPERGALESALGRVDWRGLELDGHMARLPDGCQVDLGGIAKGFIADRLAQQLKNAGATQAAINLGGNVFVLGARADGTPWRVGIQTPGRPVGEYCAAVLARDASVVTSGVYERGFDRDGVRYHHILDPRTGMPAQNDLAAVTLVTKTSVEGDALTTACLCLGKERALPLLQGREDIWALFLGRDGALDWYGPKDALLLP